MLRRYSGLMVAALALGGCALDAGGLNAGGPGQGSSTGNAGSSGGGTNPTGMGGVMNGTGGIMGAGGSMGTGGMGGSTPGVESNCLNGNDDDGDTLPDCADPDCNTVECVPSAPTGWTFVRAAISSFPAGNSINCQDNSKPIPHYIGPAECQACDCIAPGEACTGPTVACWTNAACPSTPDAEFTPLGNGCVPVLSGYKACEVIDDSQLEAGATCAPVGGGPSQLQAFQQEIHVCGVSAAASVDAGCGAGFACVGKAAAPYAGSECVKAQGPANCPAGFPQKYTAYTSFNGALSCSACNCSGVVLSCPTGQAAINVWDNVACTAEAKALVGSCVDVTVQFDSNVGGIQAYNTPSPTKSGFCTGGFDVGGFNYGGETTICCQ